MSSTKYRNLTTPKQLLFPLYHATIGYDPPSGATNYSFGISMSAAGSVGTMIPTCLRGEPTGTPKISAISVILSCATVYSSITDTLAVYVKAFDTTSSNAFGTGGDFGSITATSAFYGTSGANTLYKWDISAADPSATWSTALDMQIIITKSGSTDTVTFYGIEETFTM